MRRRDFLRSGALGAGAVGTLGAWPAAAYAHSDDVVERELPAPLRRLRPQEPPPPISEEERMERRRRAQAIMEERGIAALLVESGASLEYFTDVSWGRSERLFGMLLPRRGEAIFISPSFEKERAALGVRDRFEIRPWEEDESPFELVVRAVGAWGLAGPIAIDPSARVFVFEGVARAAGGVPRVVGGDAVIEGTRGIKTDHEIAIMRFANERTLEAFEAAFATMRPGMTQRDLATNVSAAMRQLGYSGGALVLFGESAAYPHGAPAPAPLSAGDIVLVDGGLRVHGYTSDDTRTVSFGPASAEAHEVFEVVREAQARALRAAAPGVTAGAVDTAARDYVTARGYGPGYRLFTHRLGHGIGLEGHEWPYLVRGSTVELRPGMTFSNEPGIYQYGRFGVRLEDIMAITGTGAEL
ncbi:MAG TPA: Xaa-Pro peptidase family protein, partial [Longimicrobiales bacterium]|nr:Xaa-Pro peptidase family protein [Longimicrobiales bacterium]